VAGAHTFQLRIVNQVKVEDRWNSQIVRVEPISAGKEPFPLSSIALHSEIALKLYDPLYTNFEETYEDPFANSFAGYTRGIGISIPKPATTNGCSSLLRLLHS
jgi:hypothetical protein